MKYFNLLFAIIFVVSAFVQLNDVDPLLWIAIYLSGAVLCVLSIFHKGSILLFTVALLAYLIYAVILFFAQNGVWIWLTEYNAENIAQEMQATKPWIEHTREFFGLVILAAVTGVNLIQEREKDTIKPSTSDREEW